MIKPIEFTEIITHGTNKAITKFEKDGVTIKFDKSSPEFATKVCRIVDKFIYNSKIEKTPKGLQQLVQDTFERSSNAIK